MRTSSELCFFEKMGKQTGRRVAKLARQRQAESHKWCVGQQAVLRSIVVDNPDFFFKADVPCHVRIEQLASVCPDGRYIVRCLASGDLYRAAEDNLNVLPQWSQNSLASSSVDVKALLFELPPQSWSPGLTGGWLYGEEAILLGVTRLNGEHVVVVQGSSWSSLLMGAPCPDVLTDATPYFYENQIVVLHPATGELLSVTPAFHLRRRPSCPTGPWELRNPDELYQESRQAYAEGKFSRAAELAFEALMTRCYFGWGCKEFISASFKEIQSCIDEALSQANDKQKRNVKAPSMSALRVLERVLDKFHVLHNGPMQKTRPSAREMEAFFAEYFPDKKALVTGHGALMSSFFDPTWLEEGNEEQARTDNPIFDSVLPFREQQAIRAFDAARWSWDCTHEMELGEVTTLQDVSNEIETCCACAKLVSEREKFSPVCPRCDVIQVYCSRECCDRESPFHDKICAARDELDDGRPAVMGIFNCGTAGRARKKNIHGRRPFLVTMAEDIWEVVRPEKSARPTSHHTAQKRWIMYDATFSFGVVESFALLPAKEHGGTFEELVLPLIDRDGRGGEWKAIGKAYVFENVDRKAFFFARWEGSRIRVFCDRLAPAQSW